MFDGTLKSFLLFGLLYPNKQLQVIVLCFVWEFIKLYLYENKTLSELQTMITNYDFDSQLLMNVGINFAVYYIGSFIRNLSPI